MLAISIHILLWQKNQFLNKGIVHKANQENNGRDQPVEKRDDSKTLGVLFEISQAVTQTRNLEEFYQVIHTALGKILNVDNFFIALHHQEKDSISFPYHVDEKDELPQEIPNFSRTASLTGRVIQSRRPMLFLEQDILAYAKQNNQEVIGTICKIWLGAPLIINKRVIGVIALQSYVSTSTYQAKDLDLLNAVSQHIALAIERKDSETRLGEQQQVLEAILEASPVGICLVENRIFKWVNAQMVKMFGYNSKDEFTEQSVEMVYASPQTYREAGAIIYKELTLRGKADFEFMQKRKDNTLFKAHIIVASPSLENPLESTIVIIADISPGDLAQQERLEKEKLQGVLEMAWAICHEITLPLQVLTEYSDQLDSPEAVTATELEQIKDQTSCIGDITKRLSNITRYKTMPAPGDRKIVDIWGSSS